MLFPKSDLSRIGDDLGSEGCEKLVCGTFGGQLRFRVDLDRLVASHGDVDHVLDELTLNEVSTV